MVDLIHAGNGPKILIGGTGVDYIFAGGTDTSTDIILGDSGNATFTSSGLLYFVQNNGLATFTDAYGMLHPVVLNDAGFGGNDVLVTMGNGADVIMGGSGYDLIIAGTGDVESNASSIIALRQTGHNEIPGGSAAKDTVIEDFGLVQFNSSGKLIEIFSTDPGEGGKDFLYGTTDFGIDLFNNNSNFLVIQLRQQAGTFRLSGLFNIGSNPLSYFDISRQGFTTQITNWLAQPGVQTYLANMPWEQTEHTSSLTLQINSGKLRLLQE